MTINLTYFILTVGIMIVSVISEKTLSKAGSETGASLVGVVSMLIGWGIVITLLISTLNSTVGAFFNMGGIGI